MGGMSQWSIEITVQGLLNLSSEAQRWLDYDIIYRQYTCWEPRHHVGVHVCSDNSRYLCSYSAKKKEKECNETIRAISSTTLLKSGYWQTRIEKLDFCKTSHKLTSFCLNWHNTTSELFCVTWQIVAPHGNVGSCPLLVIEQITPYKFSYLTFWKPIELQNKADYLFIVNLSHIMESFRGWLS